MYALNPYALNGTKSLTVRGYVCSKSVDCPSYQRNELENKVYVKTQTSFRALEDYTVDGNYNGCGAWLESKIWRGRKHDLSRNFTEHGKTE